MGRKPHQISKDPRKLQATLRQDDLRWVWFLPDIPYFKFLLTVWKVHGNEWLQHFKSYHFSSRILKWFCKTLQYSVLYFFKYIFEAINGVRMSLMSWIPHLFWFLALAKLLRRSYSSLHWLELCILHHLECGEFQKVSDCQKQLNSVSCLKYISIELSIVSSHTVRVNVTERDSSHMQIPIPLWNNSEKVCMIQRS